MTAWTILIAEAPLDIVEHSHNQHYRPATGPEVHGDCYAPDGPLQRSEHGTPDPLPYPPEALLCITTDHMPKHPEAGFVFGSDKDVCDILIPRAPGASVSGRQFAVTFRTDTGSLLIKNLSQRFTYIEIEGTECIKLQTQRAFAVARICVHLDGMSITLSKPWDSEDISAEYAAFLANLALMLPSPNMPTITPNAIKSTKKLPATPYNMDKKLGAGGFGSVYRAVHKFTGGFVAIKCFNQNSDASWKEANILCSLRHKNIVTFYEFNLRAQDGPQLVMEYAPLGSMLDQSRERNYNDTEGRSIIRQTLQALTYLHARRITHRDIKPGNILVFARDPAMHIKVADFGISKEADEFSTKCGTQRYVAPEVYNPPYTSKADLWSLGILVLELWVSLPPGPDERETEVEWARKILERKGKATGTVSVFLEYLLEIDPKKRLSAAECLELPFLRQADGQPQGSVETAELSMREPVDPDPDKHDNQVNQPIQENQENQGNQGNPDKVPGQLREESSSEENDDGSGVLLAIVEDDLPDTEYHPRSQFPQAQDQASSAPRGSPMDIDKSPPIPIPTVPMAEYQTVSTQLIQQSPQRPSQPQPTISHDTNMASPIPIPDTMPFSTKRYIRFFRWRGKYIGYNTDCGTVNITQILHVAGFRPGVFQRPTIQAMIGENVQKEHGVFDEGTYIVYSEAMKICRHLKMNTKALPKFLTEIIIETRSKAK